MTRHFSDFAVVDWSGENVARPSGLAVAVAPAGDNPPVLLSADGRWSRQDILDWFVEMAIAETDILIGVDLSPALPYADRDGYFPGWEQSSTDARQLWKLVEDLSHDSRHLSAVGFLQNKEVARHFRFQNFCGDQFTGGAGRMRVCESGQRAMGLSPSSCFNLIGAAQVGKSSLTGMRVLHRLNGRIPVWPFDPVPTKGPMIVEIYTSIAARAAGVRKGFSKIRDGESLDAALKKFDSRPHTPLSRYDDHATDAILTAAWLRANAARDELWAPIGMTDRIAQTEGWTFGVS